MSEQTTHPSPEELNAFSLGQLPQDAAVAVESHIGECQPCCDTLLGFSSEDTFVGLLQQAERLPAHPTVDHGVSANPSWPTQDVPTALVEHPRYEIIGLIGKGGMGDVYKAKHRLMKRLVAVKIINRKLVRKGQVVERFHREVEAAARLSHPNIVTAHDAEQAGDVHLLAMEYVDGVNLSQTVQQRGPLPISEACDYIRQATLGLEYAHERGMVHRDIKPHNLMLTADGTVKILDFGLASLNQEAVTDVDGESSASDLTTVGEIMGTPDFISPEQATDARQADARSDIYSVGATLYFLLTGQPPFSGGDVVQKLKSLAEREPESPAALRKDIPAELAAIVMKMLSKDPASRYQTPSEVAEALKPFSQSNEPLKDVEPQTQVKARRSIPALASLTAVAALFVAAIVAGAIYYLQTDHGVVRVEVTDPSLQVTIKDQTITMQDDGGKALQIRPGKQTLIVRKDDADFEFETDRFQIRRGDEIAFKVEMLQGEVVVNKDGERFHSKLLPDDVDVRQILSRMANAYAECKTYRDSGVIKSAFFGKTDSPESTVEHSFTTAFVRPDRLRIELTDEDNRLLISVNGQNVQTWWDVEPGIQKPKSLDSLEFAMAQAVGFCGGDVGRIPAMLMPKRLEMSSGMDLIDPKRIDDGKLQNAECFRLAYNFRDEQSTLWIDKQSYLVRRIDERITLDRFRVERTTTYDPTIDEKISDKMLEFDPPAPSDIKDPDLNQLQGEWELIVIQEGERKQSVPADNALVTIQGNRLLFKNATRRIEVDSNKAPKTIDFYDEEGNLRLRGIYKFNDDRLIMILHEDDKLQAENPEYPKSFDPPADNDTVLWELRKTPQDGERSTTRTILDEGYTILDGGKEIGSRRLVVTKNEETLSIAQEVSLALTFDGAPVGIVELDVSADYSVAGDSPRLMRARTSAKEQGALLMHGTVEFDGGEALTQWTTYKEKGRKLDAPAKKQATLKQPSGPLVLDSTIQVVAPLLLPEEGERKFVRVRFNNEAREGESLVEFEPECQLKRTARPEGAGFTITVFEPDSPKPEMTLDYDSQGNFESIQMGSTTVIQPHASN